MQKMPIILVTDTLFIDQSDEHVLNEAGYAVERLAEVSATEDTLKAAVPGKVGYILGGIERVTEPVLDAADALKVIGFTGTDYRGMIPAWEYAGGKGIAIANTPAGPARAVAEWAMAATLMMQRRLLELGGTGTVDFAPAPGLENQRVGIIGRGHVGRQYAEMLVPFALADVRFAEYHDETDGVELRQLLADSDIVFVAISEHGNRGFLDAAKLAQMKPGALLVSICHPGVIDEDALYAALKDGRIRAVIDEPTTPRFRTLAASSWYGSNGSTAYHTPTSIRRVSRTIVHEVIRRLKLSGDNA